MTDWAEIAASIMRMSTPIIITALGAVFCERSGVVNIGLEGMMLTGAFWGAYGSYHYGPVAGFMLAILMGMLLALVHSIAAVTFRVDQIVSGVAINILAYGLARFFSIAFFNMASTTPHVKSLPKISSLLELSPIPLLAIVLVFAAHFILERTVFGLRLKAVGENPAAADSLGINVAFYRHCGVLISGGLAGLAGAYLSIEHTGLYVEGMTQGKGFIALAAMIFGNWNPIGSCGASLLFGFAEVLSFRAVDSWFLPYQFIKMIPYILTLLVLAGVGRKMQPPAADGKPYSREENS